MDRVKVLSSAPQSRGHQAAPPAFHARQLLAVLRLRTKASGARGGSVHPWPVAFHPAIGSPRLSESSSSKCCIAASNTHPIGAPATLTQGSTELANCWPRGWGATETSIQSRSLERVEQLHPSPSPYVPQTRVQVQVSQPLLEVPFHPLRSSGHLHVARGQRVDGCSSTDSGRRNSASGGGPIRRKPSHPRFSGRTASHPRRVPHFKKKKRPRAAGRGTKSILLLEPVISVILPVG